MHRKEKILMNQSENERQLKTMLPGELRQFLLAEIETGKQTIEALSDNQLEEIVGGMNHMPLNDFFDLLAGGGENSGENSGHTSRTSTPLSGPTPSSPDSPIAHPANSQARLFERPLQAIERNLRQPTLKRSFSARF